MASEGKKALLHADIPLEGDWRDKIAKRFVGASKWYGLVMSSDSPDEVLIRINGIEDGLRIKRRALGRAGVVMREPSPLTAIAIMAICHLFATEAYVEDGACIKLNDIRPELPHLVSLEGQSFSEAQDAAVALGLVLQRLAPIAGRKLFSA